MCSTDQYGQNACHFDVTKTFDKSTGLPLTPEAKQALEHGTIHLNSPL